MEPGLRPGPIIRRTESIVGFHHALDTDYFEKDLRKTKNIELMICNTLLNRDFIP